MLLYAGFLRIVANVDGMKSWGLKEINFRTDTMIINSTNLWERTYAPIFYTVCYAPFLFNFYGSI